MGREANATSTSSVIIVFVSDEDDLFSPPQIIDHHMEEWFKILPPTFIAQFSFLLSIDIMFHACALIRMEFNSLMSIA